GAAADGRAPPVRFQGFGYLILVVAALLVLSTAGQLVGLYTDWLWFREVGFTSLFATVLRTKALVGAITGAAFFVLFHANVALARRLGRGKAFLVTWDEAQGLPSPEVVAAVLSHLALPLSVALAVIAGWLGTDRWEVVLKALNPTAFGIQDPLFERDVAFYMFGLPLWTALYAWLLTVLVLSALAAAAVYVGTGGIQVLPAGISVSRAARAHLLALAAVGLGLKAAGYRLAMFDLLFSQPGVAFGAGYADVTAQLPVLKAQMVLAGLVGLLCLVTIGLRSWRPLLAGIGVLVGVAVLGSTAYPALIQRYEVSPNELAKEKPYIDFNVRYTRLAYGLDNVEEREFPAEETLALADLRRNE